MLDRTNATLGDYAGEMEAHRGPEAGVDRAGALLNAVWRQKWVVIVAIVTALALGIGYLTQATRYYTSSTSLLIDAKKVGMTASSALEGSLTFEAGAVDSQVQVLLSDKLATTVAQRLSLQNNAAFLDPKPSPLQATLGSARTFVSQQVGKLTGAQPGTAVMDLPEAIRLILASELLQSGLKVSRLGRTYVLVIEYTDRDPALAAAIAGQYADAYLEDQLDSKFDATRRASVWMDDRIHELKSKALAADQAVQDFRARNNLTQASGRLINEQALTDANTQLSVARGELNAAKARYDRLKEIIDTKQYSGSMTDTLGSAIVSQLRTKYLQSSKLDSEITAKYGADHQSAVNARKDMDQYQRLIFEELSRMLQAYQSDLEIARDKVSSLERSVEQMRGNNAVDNEAMVKLRSLEQESQTLNALYTSFLQKFQETTQRESFPVTDARVLNPPSTPFQPSSPRSLVVLAVSLALGAVLGGLIGAVREFRDRGFRTGGQVREELGLDCVASLPVLPKWTFRAEKRSGSSRSTQVEASHKALSYVLDEPLSRFAESVRGLKIAIEHSLGDKTGAVVGIVSMYPDEGKSTVAKNYASLAAAQGARVLLIDGDVRNPKLTRDLADRATSGLLEVLGGTARLEDVIRTEERSGLAFLPGATHRRVPHTGDVLGTERMRAVIERLRADYDLIILDLPPVGVVTDALAVLRLVDRYAFVIEWGKTARNVVRDLMINEPALVGKIAGIVLTKVNLKRLSLYNAYAAYGYQGQYHNRYYGQENA